MMITNDNNTNPSQECITSFDSSARIRKSHNKTMLGNDFTPTNYDVLCGRNKESFNHVGNRRFRITISMNLKHYMEAKTKVQKTLVVVSIVDTIRALSPQGGFVKQDASGQWYEIGDKLARAKVGHALRDLIVSLRRSQERKSHGDKSMQSKEAILQHLKEREEDEESYDYSSDSTAPDASLSNNNVANANQQQQDDSITYEPFSMQEETAVGGLEDIPIIGWLSFDDGNTNAIEPDPVGSTVRRRTSALQYLDSVVRSRRVSFKDDDNEESGKQQR